MGWRQAHQLGSLSGLPAAHDSSVRRPIRKRSGATDLGYPVLHCAAGRRKLNEGICQNSFISGKKFTQREFDEIGRQNPCGMW